MATQKPQGCRAQARRTQFRPDLGGITAEVVSRHSESYQPPGSRGLEWDHSGSTQGPLTHSANCKTKHSIKPRAQNQRHKQVCPQANGGVGRQDVQGDAESPVCHCLILWRLSLSLQVSWKTGETLAVLRRVAQFLGDLADPHWVFSKSLSSKSFLLYLHKVGKWAKRLSTEAGLKIPVKLSFTQSPEWLEVSPSHCLGKPEGQTIREASGTLRLALPHLPGLCQN